MVLRIPSGGCCDGKHEKGSHIPKIDIHTHIIPQIWPNWNDKFGYPGWLHIQHDPALPVPYRTIIRDSQIYIFDSQGKANLVDGNGQFFRSVDANCWSVATRTEECQSAGVDIQVQTPIAYLLFLPWQVLSTVPGIGFNYWAKAEDALEVARFINDDLARVVQDSSSPCKFIALGTIPLQDPLLAVQELKRCVLELGMAGVQIGTHVNDWNLDAPELVPFWEVVSELDCCVFVHPWDMRSGPRYARHWFPWLVDMPNETSMAIASMLMGGVYDRWPGLRVCFAHGGGSIAHIIGRIEHGFNARPDLCQTGTKTSPQAMLREKVWVDSLVHDEDVLKLVISKVGLEHVILGTDYPFPLGEVPFPGQLIESSTFSKDPEEDAKTKRMLLYENALRFLKLSLDSFL